jgi:hypothetical protein
MNARLIIDYKECELSRKEVIALSYGVNRLTDIQSRQGYYSNTFRLPKTATNLDIFGFPDQLNSTDTKRYERLTAWIESDGVQVVYGFAQIQSVGDALEVVVKGGNADWIQLLKGLKLSDLDLRDLDHIPTVTTVKANRLNDYTDGFVYPDIDYGFMLDAVAGSLRHYHLRPSVFAYRLMTQIFADLGYTLASELEPIDLYRKMVVPFSNSEQLHSDEWATDKYFKVNIGSTVPPVGTFSPSDPISYGLVDFASSVYDNGGHVDLTANTYNPDDKMNGQTFTLSITYTLGTYSGTDTLFVAFSSPNVLHEIVLIANPVAAGTFTMSASFEWHDHGEDLNITARCNNNTFTIDSGYLESVDVDSTVLLESQWNVAINLPDMLQTDFVKHIINSFQAIIYPNPVNNSVVINLFDSIPHNEPDDWSEKIDLTNDPNFSYEYGDFKKFNTLEYSNNTDDKYLKLTPDLGEHTIENEYIDNGTNNLYKSPFSLVAVGLTVTDTLTRGLIDMNNVESGYSTLYCKSDLTITNITNTGLVTVASGANQLIPGIGIRLYDVSDALYEGGFFPNTTFWVNERVFIVASVHSDTEFQMEGDFNGDPVASAMCEVGVMDCRLRGQCANILELYGATRGDTVTFYDTVPFTTIDFDAFRPTDGSTLIIKEAFGTRCVSLEQVPSYTYDLPFIDVAITVGSTITGGTVRIIKDSQSKEAKPRFGVHLVYEDAPNAMTLFDYFSATTETFVSDVVYDEILWSQLSSVYWSTIIGIIERPQMVKALMRLSSADIHSIDFSKPKWIDYFGCLFYLSYIDQFKTNEVDSTEVELVRLP